VVCGGRVNSATPRRLSAERVRWLVRYLYVALGLRTLRENDSGGRRTKIGKEGVSECYKYNNEVGR
jgi:hypothetical protein